MRERSQFFVLISSVICAAALTQTEASLASPAIIGGELVTASDPIASTTVAIIGRSGRSEFLCSASVLAEDLAVTAGHCLGEDGKADLTLVFDIGVEHAKTTRHVTGALRPAQYLGDASLAENMFDIALVHFAGGLPSGYRPVEVLRDPEVLLDGQEVVLAGYGLDQTPSVDPSGSGVGTLRKVKVAIQEARTTGTEIRMDISHGKGACMGDSGGPAFVEQQGTLYFFGITSRGDWNCSKTAIYTNALTHLDWLDETAKALRGN